MNEAVNKLFFDVHVKLRDGGKHATDGRKAYFGSLTRMT